MIGLVQPLGAVMPLAEEQAGLVADELSGRYALPAPAEREAEMDRYERWLSRRFVSSTRHTLEVDFDDYRRQLRRERKKGAARGSVLT